MTNKITTLCALAAATLLLTGCWPKSLEPFYTEKDLRRDPALAGSWTDEEKEPEKAAVWTFQENGDRRYLLKIAGSEETMEFDARLFRLGGKDYIDLFSRQRSFSEIPAHHLLSVGISDDKLEIRMLSTQWIKDFLSRHPEGLSHMRIYNPTEPENTENLETVLTAKTAKLQKFLLEHSGAEGFFESADTLKRKE